MDEKRNHRAKTRKATQPRVALFPYNPAGCTRNGFGNKRITCWYFSEAQAGRARAEIMVLSGTTGCKKERRQFPIRPHSPLSPPMVGTGALGYGVACSSLLGYSLLFRTSTTTLLSPPKNAHVQILLGRVKLHT